MPNRHGSSTAYRYGFQGQEKDDELKGEGNSLNYTFRMHDPRVGRFFTTDPLTADYPWYSPYQFAGNKVVQFVELEGLEEGIKLTGIDLSTVDLKNDKSVEAGILRGAMNLVKPTWWWEGIKGTAIQTWNFNGGNGWGGVMEANQKIMNDASYISKIFQEKDYGAIAQLTVEFVGSSVMLRTVSSKLLNVNSVRKATPMIQESVKIMQVMEGGEDWGMVATNSGVSLGTAQVERGILEMHITVPETLRKGGILNKVVQTAVERWNPRMIKGVWEKNFNKTNKPSTNYSVYMEKIKAKMSPEKAVFETPTGKAAKKAGYTGKPTIEVNEGSIEVIFTKP
ncbi:hypothetical protein EQG63_04760 [Flavobacterium amnicola]|uniref:RHS repeat-associated core domain-containing protein n=1 Tax=Flavobacterium amnicola TaxID=2506422 RepID=A0A4Q1K5Q8_9FLAO|nr:hypothetical protein EQG63_04760 [Flavobacterium amnicola]